jgi:hypothetical protein
MTAPSITSQSACRAFAFGDQEQRLVLPDLGLTAKPVPVNPRARDLHARADQMFRMGFEASGWKLRELAWKAQGVA